MPMDAELSQSRLRQCADRELPLFEAPLGLALIELLRERGYQDTTVEEIALRSGMTRAQLGEQFDGKEDVVLCVLKSAIAAFTEQVQGAFDSEPTWPGSLRLAALAAERWLTAHPDCAWFGLVGVLEAPELARALREEVVLWGADLVDQGRRCAPSPASVPESTSLFVVGGIAEILRRHYEGSDGGSPRIGLSEMMHMAVHPYLGEEAARRELLDPDSGEGALGDSTNLRAGSALAEVGIDGHEDERGQKLAEASSAAV